MLQDDNGVSCPTCLVGFPHEGDLLRHLRRSGAHHFCKSCVLSHCDSFEMLALRDEGLTLSHSLYALRKEQYSTVCLCIEKQHARLNIECGLKGNPYFLRRDVRTMQLKIVQCARGYHV